MFKEKKKHIVLREGFLEKADRVSKVLKSVPKNEGKLIDLAYRFELKQLEWEWKAKQDELQKLLIANHNQD